MAPTRPPASSAIPALPRFLLTTLEPTFALGGVLTVLFSPTTYLTNLTRNAYPASAYDPRTQFIYTGQAGSWLYFAFVEAFVLRAYQHDVKVWRWLCAGMLLSDALYCHSIAQALGGWHVWIRVAEWTKEDWLVTITTAPFVLTRVAIALGIVGGGRGGAGQGRAGGKKDQ